MIYPIRTIVAGIADLDADPVLIPAVELAERTGSSLHLVHAFELPDAMWNAYARMGYMSGEALSEHRQRRQARLEALAGLVTRSERVRCHAVLGSADPAIREVALRDQADLILLGATRRGALARTILGTTAQRVLRRAPAPVLVLRGHLPARLRRVLLTTDLSPFSAGVHEIALDVLETLFGPDAPELRSLLVGGYGMELSPPLRHAALEQAAPAELDAFLRERRVRSRPFGGVVRYGDPAREIVAEAADWRADLLVLGTHGRSAPERWLLGSVAEAATRGATTHVLVIPAKVQEERSLPVLREQTGALAAAPHDG